MNSFKRTQMKEAVHEAPAPYYTESHLAAPDGASLFLRRWLPSSGPVRAHVLIVHGYFEHGGRYRELAHTLSRFGIGSAALDVRGHGRSEGQRGFVQRFEDYLDDVQ